MCVKTILDVNLPGKPVDFHVMKGYGKYTTL